MSNNIDTLLNNRFRAEPPKPIHPVTITTEESVNLTLTHDGVLQSFDLLGTMRLHILSQQHGEHPGFIQVKVEKSDDDSRIQYKIIPHMMDKELYTRENILVFLEKFQPWPTDFRSSILRWKMQTDHQDEQLPLSIRCLHSISGSETCVNLQYEASPMFEPLQDVVITMSIPAFQEVRNVENTDGEWGYDFKKRILEWSITSIGENNNSGSLAFVIPVVTETWEFFPISAHFMSTRTFNDVKVVDVIPLRGGDSPEFFQIKLPTCFTEIYQDNGATTRILK